MADVTQEVPKCCCAHNPAGGIQDTLVQQGPHHNPQVAKLPAPELLHLPRRPARPLPLLPLQHAFMAGLQGHSFGSGTIKFINSTSAVWEL
jgi:hypothetical protein